MKATLIFKYFQELSETQQEQLNQLYPLYKDWNDKINVISRKDIDQLVERHVLHSLSIAKFIQFSAESKVMDLGTGGGFPGIPLAILFPDVKFHLVDSINKKLKVIQEIAAEINLTNVSTEHNRVEKVNDTFDFIVSRAVAKTSQLYHWTHQKIKKEQTNEIDNGLILLKGGDLKEELKSFGRIYREQDLNEFFEEEFFQTKKIIYVPI